MTAVPRRLLILGGGPVGVEMAQAVRRLGGEVALVDGGRARARQRARTARRRARRGPAPRRHRARARRARDRGAARRRRLRPRRSTTAASCAVTACSSRPVAVRGSTASGSRPSASTPTRKGIPVDAHLRAGDRLWAIGDVTGIWPLTHAASTRATSSPRTSWASRAKPTTSASRASSSPIRRPPSVGALEARFAGDRAGLAGSPKTATYTRAYAESNGFLTLLSDGERADRRVRARPGGRRVAPAGHARHPRAGTARRAARHDPAVPDVLRDLRRRAEGAASRDRGRPRACPDRA